MFTAYTALDKCIGKEVHVRTGVGEYRGMLAGMYSAQGVALLVLVQGNGAGAQEQHIPLLHAVVTVTGG